MVWARNPAGTNHGSRGIIVEYLALYDEQGEPTGRSETRETVHRKGLLHGSAHIWLYNTRGQILLQKRSVAKFSHPGLWDVSVAGHISADEDPPLTAVREIREEIGMNVSPDQLVPVYRGMQHLTFRAGTCHDREIAFVYLLAFDGPLNRLARNRGEVSELRFFEIAELEAFLALEGCESLLVPHPGGYYLRVMEEVRKAIDGGTETC
jgi:isopentenyldiphosphate isomerase